MTALEQASNVVLALVLAGGALGAARRLSWVSRFLRSAPDDPSPEELEALEAQRRREDLDRRIAEYRSQARGRRR